MKKKEKQLTMDSVSFDFSVLNARPEGMSQAEYRDKRYYESRKPQAEEIPPMWYYSPRRRSYNADA